MSRHHHRARQATRMQKPTDGKVRVSPSGALYRLQGSRKIYFGERPDRAPPHIRRARWMALVTGLLLAGFVLACHFQ